MSQHLRVRTYLGIDSGSRDSRWGHGHGIPVSSRGTLALCVPYNTSVVHYVCKKWVFRSRPCCYQVHTHIPTSRARSVERLLWSQNGSRPEGYIPIWYQSLCVLAFVSDSFDISRHVFLLCIRPIWYQSLCVFSLCIRPSWYRSLCVFSPFIRPIWYQSLCVLASVSDPFDISRSVF